MFYGGEKCPFEAPADEQIIVCVCSSQLPVSRISKCRRRVRTNTTPRRPVRRFVRILAAGFPPWCVTSNILLFLLFVCFSVALSGETQEEAGEDGGPAGQKRGTEEAAQGSGTRLPFLDPFHFNESGTDCICWLDDFKAISDTSVTISTDPTSGPHPGVAVRRFAAL